MLGKINGKIKNWVNMRNAFILCLLFLFSAMIDMRAGDNARKEVQMGVFTFKQHDSSLEIYKFKDNDQFSHIEFKGKNKMMNSAIYKADDSQEGVLKLWAKEGGSEFMWEIVWEKQIITLYEYVDGVEKSKEKYKF